MQPKSDAQLLRDYAETADEAAFREIVLRHTDLVYSAALRQVESADLARDAAQNVFTALARKAGSLAGGLGDNASLAGWLYRGTRFEALNLRRRELRRRSRERQAMEHLLPNSESAPDWDRLRPVLDDAMAELNDADREALLLRLFKNQDLREIGAALGVSDDAAQKRVSRALEKLREILSRHGVTAGAGALGTVIAANTVQAAPAGLAAAVSAAAIAGTAVQTSTLIAATKTIAMTTLQKTIIGAALTAAVGTGIFEAHQAAQLRSQLQTLRQQQASLAEQIQQLQRERDDATSRLAGLEAENAQLQSNQNETQLLKLRGEVTRLSQANQELSITTNDANVPAESEARSDIEIPAATWTDAGFSTPQNALRTRGWAVLTGDRKLFRESLYITAAARKALEDKAVQMAATSTNPNKVAYIQEALDNKWGVADGILMPLMAVNRAKQFTGYRILSEQSLSNDERLLQVETEVALAAPTEEPILLSRIEGQWKVVIDRNFAKSGLW